jgi:hypothetical protein
MIVDPEEQWELIHDLWDQLDIGRIVAEHIPLDRRWQLDRLIERVRHMDEICDEYADADGLEEL